MDYRKLTNPEAGPSDTVPAMLTPGEAVIPAPAAQNPANKPAIEAMINEGRVKNNIFDAAESIETNEIPPIQDLQNQIVEKTNEITIRENEEFPEEISYKHLVPGLTDNYVTPLQFLMFKGLENFWAQPKFEAEKEEDLVKFEKEKAILKGQLEDQKGEFKLQQEGFKALMDNQKIIQKQNALNETLGVPKAQGSPPKPQGFYMGSDGVQYKNKETADMYAAIQAQREGVSPEETNYFTPKPDDTPIERFLDPIGASIAGLPDAIGRGAMALAEQQGGIALQRAQAGQAMGTGVTNLFRPLDAQREVPSILEPAQPVQQAPQPQVTPPAQIDSGIDMSGIIGQTTNPPPATKTPPKEKGGLGSTIVGAVKEMFDPAALTKAAVGYGVTKAMGYDDSTAAKQAADQYSLEQKRIESSKAADAKRARDLADYETKKVIDLSYTPGMTAKEMRASELNFQKRLTDNLQETAKAENRTTNKKGNKTDTALFNLGNTEQGFASEITNFFRKSGVPIYDPPVQDEMDQLVNQAYRDMVAYQKETGNKAGSIVPFMRNLQMTRLTPSGNRLLSFENDDGTRTPMDPRRSMNLDALLTRRAKELIKAEGAVDKDEKAITFNSLNHSQQKRARAAVFNDMQNKFNQTDPATIKPNEGETPFFVFATTMYK